MLVLAHILLLDSVSHNSLVRTNKIASQSPTEIENNGSDRGLKMFFFFLKEHLMVSLSAIPLMPQYTLSQPITKYAC